MKIRFLSGLLAVLLLCGMAPGVWASALYDDVPADHWAYADIQRATEAGLFQGVDAASFGIGQEITRAQFVTGLVRLFGWPSVTPDQPTFTDCAPNRWFYSAVETTYANGALPAYSAAFRPMDPITREEIATMLIRALGYTSLAGRMSAAQLPFDDVTTNRGYIAVAYDLGLINGYASGQFKPEKAAPREQAAAVMGRLYEKLNAPSRQVDRAGYTQLRVGHPDASPETAVPTTPLEPFNDLYDALKAQRAAGADMEKVAVVLTTGGIATTTQGSRITSTEELSAQEVQDYLARPDTKVFYSDRYQCAYLVATVNSSTVTVWYQDEAAIQSKLQLCRLFGVNHYILQDL